MRHLKKVIILILIACSYNGYAQIFANDSLSRIINARALDLLSKYESVIKFKSRADTTAYQNLFHNKKCLVFNDVMPENNLMQKVDVSTYGKLIRKHYSDTAFYNVTISPYELGPVTFEGDKIANLSILAQKKVHSITRNNLIYTDTFNIRFDIIADLSTNEYAINTIENIERRGSYLQVIPQYKGIFIQQKMPLDTIYANNKLYPVNKYGQVLLKDIYHSQVILFVPFHNQVLFKQYRVPENIPLFRNKLDIKKDRNIVKVKFWRWMTFADFQYHIIPNGASPIKVDKDTLGINPVNKGSFSNYLSLNIVRRVSTKGYFGIKIGAGADIFNYQLNLAQQINTYPAIDPDGDPYLRINKVYNIRETHNLVYLAAPISIEKGFTFGKNSVYIQAAYYFMKKYTSTYNLDANATYAGFYDYLFNLTISENGVYDFGTYDFKLRSIPLSPKKMFSTYSLGLGYKREISRRIYLDFGFNYRAGGGYLFEKDNKNLSDSSKGINSLVNLTHQFKVEYVNMNFGLSVKI